MIPQSLKDAYQRAVALFMPLERGYRRGSQEFANALYQALMALAVYWREYKTHYNTHCHPADNHFRPSNYEQVFEDNCRGIVGKQFAVPFEPDKGGFATPHVFFAALVDTFGDGYMDYLSPQQQAAVRATGLPVHTSRAQNSLTEVKTLTPDQQVRQWKLRYLATRDDEATRLTALSLAKSLPPVEQAHFYNQMREHWPRFTATEKQEYQLLANQSDLMLNAPGSLSGAGCSGGCGCGGRCQGNALSGAVGFGFDFNDAINNALGQDQAKAPSSGGISLKDFTDLLGQLVKGGIGVAAAAQKLGMTAEMFQTCKEMPEHPGCPWNKGRAPANYPASPPVSPPVQKPPVQTPTNNTNTNNTTNQQAQQKKKQASSGMPGWVVPVFLAGTAGLILVSSSGPQGQAAYYGTRAANYALR